MWSVECGAWSVERGVWSVECGFGFHHQRGGSGLVSGRLKNVVAVADDERKAVELVEGIARQVDFARLAVGKGDAVIDHRRVASANAAHRHRFHTACTAVVAHGDSCEMAQRVAQRMNAESNHLFAVDSLNRNRRSHIVFAHDIDPRQVINDAIALSICQADVQKR